MKGGPEEGFAPTTQAAVETNSCMPILYSCNASAENDTIYVAIAQILSRFANAFKGSLCGLVEKACLLRNGIRHAAIALRIGQLVSTIYFQDRLAVLITKATYIPHAEGVIVSSAHWSFAA